jgi:RNA polymerase sigma-70 factor (ECF subfamily)
MTASGDSNPNASIPLFMRAREGDSDALNQLLSRYLPRLEQWASRRLPMALRSILSTDDLVQDAVINALGRIDHIEIRTEGGLLPYLRQAVRNRIIDLYRRKGRRPARESLPLDAFAADPSPLEQAIGTEAEERYEAALDRLSDPDRNAIILKVEFDCDYDEIAETLGKPSAAAARMSVTRAIGRLAREMGVDRARPCVQR